MPHASANISPPSSAVIRVDAAPIPHGQNNGLALLYLSIEEVSILVPIVGT